MMRRDLVRLKSKMPGILMTILAFMIPPSANADESAYALTTTRLNLRSCPSSQGCGVLRTLGVKTHLQILERQGEWLHVVALPEQDEGWVHSSYTQSVAPPERTDFSSFLATSNFLQTIKLPFFLTTAILLGSWLVGKRQQLDGSSEKPLTLITMSLGVGLVFILNQFGPLVARHTSSFFNLSFLSFLWEINDIAPAPSYSKIIVGIVFLCAALAAVAPSGNGSRESFLQGVGAGFSLLPASVTGLALLGLAGWLILLLFKLVGYVFGLLLIPILWICENILLPILRILATPLVWLWDNYLREICLLLAKPFIWLWHTLLFPLFALVYKYILIPILTLALGIVTATMAMLPIVIVGLSIIDAVKSSVRGRLDCMGFFSQGMAMGFMLFDATLLIALDRLNILHSTPPLSLLFILALPIFMLIRKMFSREASETESHSFLRKLVLYSRSSKVELMSACFVMPALLIVAILASGEDG